MRIILKVLDVCYRTKGAIIRDSVRLLGFSKVGGGWDIHELGLYVRIYGISRKLPPCALCVIYVMSQHVNVFIFMSASAEYQSVKITETLKEYTASDVMRADVERIPNHLIVQQAINYLIKEEHGDFILEDENDRFNGVILRGRLYEAKQKNELETPIEALKTNKIALVDSASNFHDLFDAMQKGKIRAFVVQEEGDEEVLGIIDSYGVNQFLHKSGIIKPNPIQKWMQQRRKK